MIIGLQVWAVVDYRDDWPFASNSMFSFRREPNDHVYDLQLTVEVDGRWRRLAPTQDLGAEDDESFRRLFFTRWYGSTDPDYPQRSFAHDDPPPSRHGWASSAGTVDSEMHARGQQVEVWRSRWSSSNRRATAGPSRRSTASASAQPIDRGFSTAVDQT